MPGETDLHADSARRGDPEAFAALYERVAPALSVWAELRLRGPLRRRHDPEDLLQEVWWRALDNFADFDPQRGGFRGWLFGFAKKIFMELLRRPTRGGRTVLDDHELPEELNAELTSITTKARRNESAVKLVEFARGLPDEDVEVFVRCALEGTKVKDVAPIIDASYAAAKKRWERLRGRMQELKVWSELLDE